MLTGAERVLICTETMILGCLKAQRTIKATHLWVHFKLKLLPSCLHSNQIRGLGWQDNEDNWQHAKASIQIR
jgi:hypothetical protein